MNAILTTGVGGTEVLQPSQVPVPEIRTATGVRVRVHAAALNPVDYKLRRNGVIAEPADGRTILGCDGAGVVDSIGSGVTAFKPGDEVYYTNGGFGPVAGNYAEYAIVDEAHLAHKPRSLDFVRAAAVPLVLITAWEALYDRAGITAGDYVVVQAGAGGVGHVAVQLAAIAGAHVAATVSTPEKAALAKSLGAERTIDYRNEDVTAAVNAWSGGGAHLVFDTVGHETFVKSFDLVRPYGAVVSCVETDVNIGGFDRPWLQNFKVGFEWMPAPQVYDLPEARLHQTEILRRGAALIDEGKLRVVVGATFPLQEVAAAHAALEAGRVTGKIVLQVS